MSVEIRRPFTALRLGFLCLLYPRNDCELLDMLGRLHSLGQGNMGSHDGHPTQLLPLAVGMCLWVFSKSFGLWFVVCEIHCHGAQHRTQHKMLLSKSCPSSFFLIWPTTFYFNMEKIKNWEGEVTSQGVRGFLK